MAFQSPRVYEGEAREKLLLLATLAYGFLLSLLNAGTEPLRLFRRSWQMLPVRTLLLSDQKVDLLPQLREQIHLISRFLAALRLSAKPFSRNFGMTHVSLVGLCDHHRHVPGDGHRGPTSGTSYAMGTGLVRLRSGGDGRQRPTRGELLGEMKQRGFREDSWQIKLLLRGGRHELLDPGRDRHLLSRQRHMAIAIMIVVRLPLL